jgi:hypothetical protein
MPPSPRVKSNSGPVSAHPAASFCINSLDIRNELAMRLTASAACADACRYLRLARLFGRIVPDAQQVYPVSRCQHA